MNRNASPRKRISNRIARGCLVVAVAGLAGWVPFACVGNGVTVINLDTGPTPGDGDAGEDAFVDAGDAEANTPVTMCPASAPFKNVVEVGGVNTSGAERAPSLTVDEKTIVFLRGQQLYIATRDAPNASFGLPTPITGLSDSKVSGGGQLSASGSDMVFSDSAGICYLIHLEDGGTVGTPTLLLPNWTKDCSRPFLTSDGSELFLASTRDSDAGMFQLYRSSKLDDGTFSNPALIPELASSNPSMYAVFAPILNQNGLTLYFATTYPSQTWVWHVQMTDRATIGSSFNNNAISVNMLTDGGFSEAPGWLSEDGCRLYFESTRNSTYDLFVATK